MDELQAVMAREDATLDYVQPGTLTTLAYRTRIYLRLLSVGRIPTWVRLALLGNLPKGVVGGIPRA